MYIPKFRPLSVPSLWLMGMCLMGCSSEGIGTEPVPENPAARTVTLKFALGANAFTKADDNSGNAVEKLTLSFYHSNGDSPLFLQNVEATASTTSGKTFYEVSLDVIPGKEPDMVIAFANVSKNDLPTNHNDLFNTKVDNVNSGENLIMTTPRYFSSNNEDIFYQTFDYTSNETIELEVERIAAKVSVSISSDSKKFTDVDAKNSEGNSIQLKLDLDSWGITATDKQTFLIRNVGSYDEMNNIFNGWSDWNNPNKKELNWAMSVNYEFTNQPYLLSVSEANIPFGMNCFSHESTRNFGKDKSTNDRPSVVLLGHYSRSDKDGRENFFNYKSYIYTEEELTNILMAKAANALKSSTDDIKGYLKLSYDKNSPLVSIQAAEDFPLSGYKDKEGNEIADIKTLNGLLLEACGMAEMYKDGKCYFIVPIEHATNGTQKIYGLVRNHFYNLSIKEISGLGRGIADDDQILGEIPPIDDSHDECNIKFTLTVRDWTNHYQDINIIPADK